MNPASPSMGRIEQWLRRPGQRLSEVAGGPARLKVIGILAWVLGLEAADVSTVGAVAVPLEKALHIGNVDVGLLVTASTVAMAGPAVASLTGDLFKVSERGRIYGYILTGELVGAGVGIEISGALGALTWRAAFAWLVVPGLALAFAIWRYLPEPARGGQSRMAEGAQAIVAATNVADGALVGGGAADEEETPAARGAIEQEVAAQQVPPRPGLVLRRDPGGRSLWWAVRYVLAVPTNRRLILGSALGYFYFQGLRTFAVEFLRERFGLGQGAASLLLLVIGAGAVVGALVTGRLADRLITGGLIPGRVWVAGISFLAAVALLAPGLVSTSMAVAVPLFFLGAAGLGGANSPLDAARLDIMHSRLWGRAEAVRTCLRSSLEAVAPLAFGLLSSQLDQQTSRVGHPVAPIGAGAAGLDLTFLLMLAPEHP